MLTRRRFFAEDPVGKATTLAARARRTRQYMQTFRRLRNLNRAFACERGHFGCAAESDGAFTDELLHLIGSTGDSDAPPRS